jgi:hypothetical protein
MTVLSGCSGLPGTPQAAPEITSAAPPPSTGEEQTGPADSPIGDLRPCDMISDQLAAARGLKGKGTTRYAGARACQFGEDETMAIVTMDDQQSIDALQTYPKTGKITVGSHQGRQVRDALERGTCSIALPTGPRTYVEFFVKTGEDTEKACVSVNEIAKAAEPKLP